VKYNVFNPEKTTTELYNLATDISEEKNVAAENPEVVKELQQLMDSARTDNLNFLFQAPVSKK
jgi:arylsulfatase A-like enzyme